MVKPGAEKNFRRRNQNYVNFYREPGGSNGSNGVNGNDNSYGGGPGMRTSASLNLLPLSREATRGSYADESKMAAWEFPTTLKRDYR